MAENTSFMTIEQFRGWVGRFEGKATMRPQILAELMTRMASSGDRRRIVDTEMGLKLYLDPVSLIGREIAHTGKFEPETMAVFKEHLGPGKVCLDVGANEGVFSAYAAKLVSGGGTVIAVEPQSRLKDIIWLNLLLNGQGTTFHVVPNALGQNDGKALLNLYPSLNSGASSFHRKARFFSTTDEVEFKSPEAVLDSLKVDVVDFAKVDVEGFENKVAPALAGLLRAGRIKTLYLDFHKPVLDQVGAKAEEIHKLVLDTGMKYVSGPTDTYYGYILYTWK